VGEDQKQHIELVGDLADIFNRTYKAEVFPLPQYVASRYPAHLQAVLLTPRPAPSRRILSLKDTTSKMSKSAPDTASRILLTDTAATIAYKIRGSVTDSLGPVTYDPVLRPGTSNLLTILAACTDEDVHRVAQKYEGKGHGVLKGDVAEAVESMIERPRKELERLRGERGYLREVSSGGALRARERSEVTMREIRARVGLL
jgi:tryptophanyl-tRNA synthetase